MMWKKAALLSLAGFVLGVAVGICLMLIGSSSFLTAFPHILLGSVYGAVAMGGSVVYGIENWSIARATATHFLLVFVLFVLLAVWMGWLRLKDPVFWIVLAAMAVAYVLIWLIQYLSYRKKVRKINEDLAKWRSRKSAD